MAVCAEARRRRRRDGDGGGRGRGGGGGGGGGRGVPLPDRQLVGHHRPPRDRHAPNAPEVALQRLLEGGARGEAARPRGARAASPVADVHHRVAAIPRQAVRVPPSAAPPLVRPGEQQHAVTLALRRLGTPAADVADERARKDALVVVVVVVAAVAAIAAAAAAVVDHPRLVIQLALLGVGEDGVRAADLLEALGRRLVPAILVGVRVARGLEVRPFDGGGVGVGLDAEELVEAARRHRGVG
mmetsp:Transcript_2611/g.8408  ORF Transcript_2611/g.8408 Transcript_2611/m.8408 type:complete len:242 (+) Transcript_2611:238-963(+)